MIVQTGLKQKAWSFKKKKKALNGLLADLLSIS